MPLGAGYTAEEQVTGQGEVGGVQMVVYPMKRDVFERRFPRAKRTGRGSELYSMASPAFGDELAPEQAMGLAPGGKMTQEIYDDPFAFADWDLRRRSRCFLHLANSMAWRQITGAEPPTVPPTAKEYTEHGLPWFDYYAETPAVDGGGTLGKVLNSVGELGKGKVDAPLPENQTVVPGPVLRVGPVERPGKAVREW